MEGYRPTLHQSDDAVENERVQVFTKLLKSRLHIVKEQNADAVNKSVLQDFTFYHYSGRHTFGWKKMCKEEDAYKLFRSVKSQMIRRAENTDSVVHPYAVAIAKWGKEKKAVLKLFSDLLELLAEESSLAVSPSESKMDRNPLVLAWLNGCFERRTLVWRPVKRSDWISTGFNYKLDINVSKNKQARFKKELELLFTHPYQCANLIRQICNLLTGNLRRRGFIYEGETGT